MKIYQVHSTVAKGMKLNVPFLKSIETFLKEKKGTLHLHEVVANYKSDKMDSRIDQSLILKNDLKFSRNIRVVVLEGVRAETGSPLNKLADFCGLEQTLVAAGNSISMKSLPSYPDENGNRVERYVATTGSLVFPRYKNTPSGRSASKNHNCGAVVLIKDENGRSEFVHIQAGKDGSFPYFGKRYHSDGTVTTETGVRSVLGDLHPISVDNSALKATLGLLKTLNVEDVFLNDADDFRNSQSHHLKDRHHTKAKLHLDGKLDIKNEQGVNYRVIKSIQDTISGLTLINKSNHDEHRDQAIERGDYIFDETAYEPLHIQALLGLYGADSFQVSLVAEEAVRKALKEVVKLLNNHDYDSEVKIKLDQGLKKVRFLNRRTLIVVNGKLVLSKHGDDGIGGARGSTKTFAQLGIAGVYGHGHFEEWYKNVIRVATLSKLNMDYNEGQPTNWSQSIVLVYPDGTGQIARIRNGSVLY